MQFIFSIIGVILGAIVAEFEGAVFGLVCGFLFGAYLNVRGRIATLENELKNIRANLSVTPTEAPGSEQTLVPPTQNGVVREDTLRPPEDISALEQEQQQEQEQEIEIDIELPPVTAAPPAATPPGLFEKAVDYLKHFFTTGNVVVKVGVIILFFGVGFLIKYAAERSMFPIALRLTVIGIAGIVMLILGWRLRHKRLEYAVILQGAAVGVLYLTVFAAAKLTHLPAAMALLIMIAMVILSGFLAVVQNANALATIAAVGGFLAPVLTSTGSNNYIGLFSYYALLNAGILGVAWFKAWRSLNWVGFMFTFIIGMSWGYKYYVPANFSSVEPFLLLFFFFYLFISVLFSYRQPPQLKGLVDGTLVFGVPLAAFALQSALVKRFEFGQAYSALGLSAVYITLARALWKKEIAGMRLLTEAFLALGVIFATLAIPLALDGRWTAAVWSLEGAGMVWIGVHQRRLLVRCFGLLLQVGAASAFLSTIARSSDAIPILNSVYLGCLLISLAGLFTSYYYYRHRESLLSWEKVIHILLLVWGVAWWFGSGVMEIDRYVKGAYKLKSFLFFMAASFTALDFAAARLKWQSGRLPAVVLLPAMVLIAFGLFISSPSKNPFSNWGFVSWLAALAGQYLLLYRIQGSWPLGLQRAWHAGSLWLLVFISAWAASAFVDSLIQGGGAWGDLLWGLIPAATLLAVMRYHEQIEWPLAAFKESYFRSGLFPIAFFTALWVLVSSFSRGDPQPLTYFPILNPLELAQLFVLIVLMKWLNKSQQGQIPAVKLNDLDILLYGLAAVAFVWLNAVVARTVHFWAGVNFNMNTLHHSALFQASISIVWTLAALTIAGTATRLGRRRLWFIGAALIAAVVFKLIFVDLKDIGTIPRIISFLTVGILLMIIGYFSPLPPKLEKD